MRATHIDYKHPRHLRVEDGGKVYCLAPSHSQYSGLAKAGLPAYDEAQYQRDVAETSANPKKFGL